MPPHQESLDLIPDQTALVLIDMQGSVATHAAAPHTTDQVIGRAQDLLEAARSLGMFVVFVRTSFLADNSDSLTWTLPVDAKRPAPSRPDGWDALLPGFAPTPTEPVVVKRGVNAFHASDLDLQLRRHGIRTVVMAGISTSGGVEGTARAAFDHGYAVVFDEEAMAASTAEEHAWSIDRVFPKFGRVRDHATTLGALSGRVAA